MDDKGDVEAGLCGCAGIALFVAGWLLLQHGPVSWFFFGALIGASLLLALNTYLQEAPAQDAGEQKASGAATPQGLTVRMRAVTGAVSGAMKFLFSLAIGFGIVLVMQVAFSWWGTGAEATDYGNFEQKFWGFLVELKQVVGSMLSLGAILVLVLLALVMNSWAAIAVIAKARKWMSNAIGVLAAMLAFSFVTGAPAESRYGVATHSVRAAFLGKLDGLAEIRKEQAAYKWANASAEEKFSEPRFRAAFDDYLATAVGRCRNYNDYMEERTAAALADFPDPPASVREVRFTSSGRLRSYHLRQFFPGCDPPQLAPLLASNIAVVKPDNYEFASWTPDFAADRRLSGFISQAEWKRKFDRADAAIAQAAAARNAMKGALAGTVGARITSHLELPADPFINILKDAALGALAADTEKRIRRWLERTGAGDTRLAPASRRALLFAFPDSDFVRSGIFDPTARSQEAIEAMDAAVPNASQFVDEASKGVGEFRNFIRAEEERKERQEEARRIAEAERIEMQRKADRELREWAQRNRNRGRRGR